MYSIDILSYLLLIQLKYRQQLSFLLSKQTLLLFFSSLLFLLCLQTKEFYNCFFLGIFFSPACDYIYKADLSFFLSLALSFFLT